MSSHRTHARLSALLATLCGLVASASTPPIVIDTEQKAAAAVLTAFRAGDEIPQDFHVLTHLSRKLVERALQAVGGATTPAALLANRNGKRVACPVSGNLTATLSRGLPRVLKIEWSRCRYEEFGWYHTLTGTSEVTLFSDSLAPTRVAAIRHGTDRKDLSEELLMIQSTQTVPDVHSYNLRICGEIPMARMFPNDGPFVGPFAFEITGFYHESTNVQVAGEGERLFQITDLWSAEGARLVGSRTGGGSNATIDDDFTLRSGKFSFVYTFPAISTQPEQVLTRRYTADELRVHRVSNYLAGTEQLSIDGRAKYTWRPAAGNGCISGQYVFATNIPMNRPHVFGENVFDSGEILINGSTLASFSLLGPPTSQFPFPDGMRVHVNAAAVGVFDYDGFSVAGALQGVATCY